MNPRTLTRRIVRIAVLGTVAALAACATAPPARETSILDLIDNNQRASLLGPASCAALNTAALCEKSTRLDRGRNCSCADPRRLTDSRAFQR